MCCSIPSRYCLFCLSVCFFVNLFCCNAEANARNKLNETKYVGSTSSIVGSYSPVGPPNHYHDDRQLQSQDSVRRLLREEATSFFVSKLMDHFGHGGVMYYDDFVILLSELGLQTSRRQNASVVHRMEHGPYRKPHRHRRDAEHAKPQTTRDFNNSGVWNTSLILSNPCLSPKQILYVHQHDPRLKMNERDLLAVCPSLIYQVIDRNCWRRPPPIMPSIMEQLANIPAYKWAYSTGAVFIISLIGLLGVAVIPVMQKVFYNHLLQYLVALAVGALSGDALLHLLPHAIEGVLKKEDDHDHSNGKEHEDLGAMWIGMTGLASIFFFFLLERILTIVTRMKNTKKRMKTKNVELEKLNKTEDKLESSVNPWDQLCHDCEKVVTMMIHPNKDDNVDPYGLKLAELADGALDDIGVQWKRRSASGAGGNVDDAFVAVNNHDGEHGHGHHTVPHSVSAVAWMVILGDGIHNFSDGLAIGVGFASSVPVGVSTSIAVFCHELPHEIGDFAVLLRAGMKIKQAVAYNCLSSLLCFIGMLIGVAIGNIASANLWIFAVVAGMFLYIALVDMLPEMTAVMTKKGENQFYHLMLQSAGMMTGSGIMFLIAYFEDSMRKSF